MIKCIKKRALSLQLNRRCIRTFRSEIRTQHLPLWKVPPAQNYPSFKHNYSFNAINNWTYILYGAFILVYLCVDASFKKLRRLEIFPNLDEHEGLRSVEGLESINILIIIDSILTFWSPTTNFTFRRISFAVRANIVTLLDTTMVLLSLILLPCLLFPCLLFLFCDGRNERLTRSEVQNCRFDVIVSLRVLLASTFLFVSLWSDCCVGLSF